MLLLKRLATCGPWSARAPFAADPLERLRKQTVVVHRTRCEREAEHARDRTQPAVILKNQKVTLSVTLKAPKDLSQPVEAARIVDHIEHGEHRSIAASPARGYVAFVITT